MPIYMQISGIDGDSTNTQFANWFEISSYSWGETNGVSASGGGGGAGKVHFHDMSFSKRTGKGSPLLFLACASGKHIPAVQLVVTTANSDSQQVFLKITLGNVFVSSYQQGGDGGSMPQDEVSLNFTKIEFDQTILVDGSVTVQSATWDLKNGNGR